MGARSNDRLDLHGLSALQPQPPSGRTGLLYSHDAPSLTPNCAPARGMPSLQKSQPQLVHKPNDRLSKSVWSDSMAHMMDEPWPAHSVPLFIFSDEDRPRPGYHEEVRFILRDDKYVNFALRLKCGKGDRYMGGSVGLVYCNDGLEVRPGTQGQLVTITEIIVQADNTAMVCAVGDLDFVTKRTWMPRGLQGLQIAIVEVVNAAPHLTPIPRTCIDQPGMRCFAQMLESVPTLAQMLAGTGPFTVFVPTNQHLALFSTGEDGLPLQPDTSSLLACHACSGRVLAESMYSGRQLRALDGTMLVVTFARWPRSNPCVNDIPIEHMDIMCSNGVIHCIGGVLSASPAAGRPVH